VFRSGSESGRKRPQACGRREKQIKRGGREKQMTGEKRRLEKRRLGGERSRKKI